MKKIIITLYFLASILFVGCVKEDTDNVSKTTYYPTITLNGEATEVLKEGESYSEKGAVSLAGTATLETKIEGQVNSAKVGVYKLIYSAKNVDGFSANKTRTIVVLSKATSTIDLSGTFTRNGNQNMVTKISDRVYQCNNATGYNVQDDKITLTFYNLDDKVVYAPFQEHVSNSGLSAESNLGTITSKDKWSWVIYASAVFGQAERVFTR